MNTLNPKNFFPEQKEDRLAPAKPVFNFEKDHVAIPANQIPSWRFAEAKARNAHGNWLFFCWGGLGDIICAEPTIRWAHKNLPRNRFAIASEQLDIFEHIDCEKFEIKDNFAVGSKPEEWYQAPVIFPFGHLTWEFYSHCLMQAVDYVSVNVFNMQLPVKDREIKLPNFPAPDLDYSKAVIVHPGKHWPSKTFPASWWQRVCDEIQSEGYQPVLIGKTVDANVGYVDFYAPNCIDLRDKLSLKEFIGVAKAAHCVISNDSAIIHAAASGDAHIGAIATCKHPDYISHWRRGVWQWRFRNLSLGGLYENAGFDPFTVEDISVEYMSPEAMAKALPPPRGVGAYAAWAMNDYAETQKQGYCAR